MWPDSTSLPNVNKWLAKLSLAVMTTKHINLMCAELKRSEISCVARLLEIKVREQKYRSDNQIRLDSK